MTAQHDQPLPKTILHKRRHGSRRPCTLRHAQHFNLARFGKSKGYKHHLFLLPNRPATDLHQNVEDDILPTTEE